MMATSGSAANDVSSSRTADDAVADHQRTVVDALIGTQLPGGDEPTFQCVMNEIKQEEGMRASAFHDELLRQIMRECGVAEADDDLVRTVGLLAEQLTADFVNEAHTILTISGGKHSRHSPTMTHTVLGEAMSVFGVRPTPGADRVL